LDDFSLEDLEKLELSDIFDDIVIEEEVDSYEEKSYGDIDYYIESLFSDKSEEEKESEDKKEEFKEEKQEEKVKNPITLLTDDKSKDEEINISDEFDSFLKKLINILYTLNFINDSTIKSAQEFLGSNIYSLRGDRQRYNTDIAEYILDQWYARIINKAVSLRIQKGDMKDLHRLFKEYYEISYYNQSNQLFRPYRILLYRIIDLLFEANIVERNTLDILVDKIGLDFRHILLQI